MTPRRTLNEIALALGNLQRNLRDHLGLIGELLEDVMSHDPRPTLPDRVVYHFQEIGGCGEKFIDDPMQEATAVGFITSIKWPNTGEMLDRQLLVKPGERYFDVAKEYFWNLEIPNKEETPDGGLIYNTDDLRVEVAPDLVNAEGGLSCCGECSSARSEDVCDDLVTVNDIVTQEKPTNTHVKMEEGGFDMEVVSRGLQPYEEWRFTHIDGSLAKSIRIDLNEVDLEWFDPSSPGLNWGVCTFDTDGHGRHIIPGDFFVGKEKWVFKVTQKGGRIPRIMYTWQTQTGEVSSCYFRVFDVANMTADGMWSVFAMPLHGKIVDKSE